MISLMRLVKIPPLLKNQPETGKLLADEGLTELGVVLTVVATSGCPYVLAVFRDYPFPTLTLSRTQVVLAENKGIEPLRPFGRLRCSKPLHYLSANSQYWVVCVIPTRTTERVTSC